MRRLVTAALAAAALLSLAAAPAPPKALVDHVRAEINGDVDPQDEDPMPVREPGPKMFKRLDFNSDGVADWLVDYDGFYAWCGTGGCRRELWLGQPDGGLALVFGDQVITLKVKRGKPAAVLDVDYHGAICGLTGVEECLRRYVWDPAEMAFLPAINRKGSGLLVGLPPAVVDIDPKAAPPEVRAQAAALSDLCAQAGGKREAPPEIGRLPDLNGDGVREWYVGAQYPDCQEMTEPSAAPEALVILVSQAGGPFTLAWGAVEPDVGFDISIRPAVMLQFERPSSCDLTNDCPRKPMRWDPASRKLSPVP